MFFTCAPRFSASSMRFLVFLSGQAPGAAGVGAGVGARVGAGVGVRRGLHGVTLHLRSCGAGHTFPPCFASSTTSGERLWRPPPHVREQPVHADQ